MHLFLINTFLGFFLAQAIDLLRRSKASEHSPEKFDFVFFWKDNRGKIIISLLLSFGLSVFVYLNVKDFASLIGKDFEFLNNLVYGVIGFAPEYALQYIKRKFGILQPKEVTIVDENTEEEITYNRKN